MHPFVQQYFRSGRQRTSPPQNRRVPLIHQLRHSPKLKVQKMAQKWIRSTKIGLTPLTYSQALDSFRNMLELSHVCRGSHGTGHQDKLEGKVMNIDWENHRYCIIPDAGSAEAITFATSLRYSPKFPIGEKRFLSDASFVTISLRTWLQVSFNLWGHHF